MGSITVGTVSVIQHMCACLWREREREIKKKIDSAVRLATEYVILALFLWLLLWLPIFITSPTRCTKVVRLLYSHRVWLHMIWLPYVSRSPSWILYGFIKEETLGGLVFHSTARKVLNVFTFTTIMLYYCMVEILFGFFIFFGDT